MYLKLQYVAGASITPRLKKIFKDIQTFILIIGTVTSMSWDLRLGNLYDIYIKRSYLLLFLRRFFYGHSKNEKYLKL